MSHPAVEESSAPRGRRLAPGEGVLVKAVVKCEFVSFLATAAVAHDVGLRSRGTVWTGPRAERRPARRFRRPSRPEGDRAGPRLRLATLHRPLSCASVSAMAAASSRRYSTRSCGRSSTPTRARSVTNSSARPSRRSAGRFLVSPSCSRTTSSPLCLPLRPLEEGPLDEPARASDWQRTPVHQSQTSAWAGRRGRWSTASRSIAAPPRRGPIR